MVLTCVRLDPLVHSAISSSRRSCSLPCLGAFTLAWVRQLCRSGLGHSDPAVSEVLPAWRWAGCWRRGASPAAVLVGAESAPGGAACSLRAPCPGPAWSAAVGRIPLAGAGLVVPQTQMAVGASRLPGRFAWCCQHCSKKAPWCNEPSGGLYNGATAVECLIRLQSRVVQHRTQETCFACLRVEPGETQAAWLVAGLSRASRIDECRF